MELPAGGLEEIVDNEDYYSLLNASRDSSQEELKSCYRRLCMVYHPDKHEYSKHKDASEIFKKIQIAYNVLSDPTKRYIYDLYGSKGLEADWQIVERRKTPDEIREEYERLLRLKAQHRLEERTTPQGAFSMTINATSLFDNPFADDEFYDETLILPDVAKMSLSQSVQAPLTLNHTTSLTGSVESSNGNGNGTLAVGLRSTLSQSSWQEFELGVSDSKQINFGVKGYKIFGKGLFALVQIPVRMYLDSDSLIVERPELHCTFGNTLGKDMSGSLNFGIGTASHMATNFSKETQRFRFSVKLQLGIPDTYGICSVIYKLPEEKGRLRAALKGGTIGWLLEYGGEHRISRYSTVAAYVNVGIPFGVLLKLKLNRASFSYSMPIQLSDEFNVIAVFYGTVIPIAVYAALQTFVIRPFKRREKEREQEENEKSLINEISKKKAAAESLIEMMKQSTQRKIEIEERKLGLIISKGLYGCFVTDQKSTLPAKLIDVTIPLQNLVESSSLQLPRDITKSGLPGFYDPCPGREKKLKVIYRFRGGLHQVVIDDRDTLRIPLKSHVVGWDEIPHDEQASHV